MERSFHFRELRSFRFGKRGYEGDENGGWETGKQCKAVPTLRKLRISAFAESVSFMLVEALPQSPPNTKVVFWNAG